MSELRFVHWDPQNPRATLHLSKPFMAETSDSSSSMPPSPRVIPIERGNDIAVLCRLIMCCEDFKADMKQLAPFLGISRGSNVPRRINAIVNPFGFEFKGGKMVELGDGTPSTPSKKTTNTTSTATINNTSPKKKTGASATKTPATTPQKQVENVPTTPESKKRKLSSPEVDEGVNFQPDINPDLMDSLLQDLINDETLVFDFEDFFQPA